MSKVLSIQIENFKCIDKVDVDLKGRSVFVIGDNGTGKTSFIQALWNVLTGKDIPSKPIQDGKTEAIIKAKFGDVNNEWEAELKFNAANPKGKLTVRNAKGEKQDSPRTLLENLIGNISFDPFDFIRETPAKQIKFIKEFAGLDFVELDTEKKEVFENRTIQNKEIKNLEGKIAESNVTESDVISFKELKDEAEIKEQIRNVDAKNKIHNDGQAQLTALKTEHKTKTDKHEENIGKIEELHKMIKDLQDKNEVLKNEADIVQERIQNGEKFIQENPLVSSIELNERYQKIIQFNNKVKEVQGVVSDMDRLNDMKQIADGYSGRLAEIDQIKIEMVNNAKMPIRGIGFTDDYLTLNGREFSEDQIPKSHIIQAGIEIMMALNPKLKICRIKDGSLLGSKQYEVVNMIQEQGFQMFMEIVDENKQEVELEFIELLKD